MNEIQRQLELLRQILPQTGRQPVAFDGFLREQEFGLARHVICDYLAEPSSARADTTIINRIHDLHAAMGMEDGVFVRFWRKEGTIALPPAEQAAEKLFAPVLCRRLKPTVEGKWTAYRHD